MNKKTIQKNVIIEQEITKSKFISHLFHVKDEDQVKKYLEEIRKKHFKASHNCYAFIIDESLKRSSDDGEPSGTAGKPILLALEGSGLSEVLCIVTRYFGGTKLGTGGLVKAYGSSTTLALDSTNIVEWVDGYVYQINFKYNHIDTMNYHLNINNIKIIDQQFFEEVTYFVETTLDELSFKGFLNRQFNSEIEISMHTKKLIPLEN